MGGFVAVGTDIHSPLGWGFLFTDGTCWGAFTFLVSSLRKEVIVPKFGRILLRYIYNLEPSRATNERNRGSGLNGKTLGSMQSLNSRSTVLCDVATPTNGRIATPRDEGSNRSFTNVSIFLFEVSTGYPSSSLCLRRHLVGIGSVVSRLVRMVKVYIQILHPPSPIPAASHAAPVFSGDVV